MLERLCFTYNMEKSKDINVIASNIVSKTSSDSQESSIG